MPVVSTLTPCWPATETATWLTFSSTYPGVLAFATFPAMTEMPCWVVVTPAKAADNAWERPMCSSRPRHLPSAA